MNIVEELAKKYEGVYSEESMRGVTFPQGRYTFQPQKGVINVEGTIISVNIKAVGGAARTAEPYRIMLQLDKDYKIAPLEIFPRSFFNRLFREFFPISRSNSVEDVINKEFSFKGKDTLVKTIMSNSILSKNLKNEFFFIVISKKFPQHIVLTPKYGVGDLTQFEKFLVILKQIEREVIENSFL